MVRYITELFFDGTWNDITPDVRDKAPIKIVRGRRDWATVTDPATLSLTLNNGPSKASAGAQGRYSPRNPRSDLFGKISRNTPIRVREDRARSSYLVLPGVAGSSVTTPDVAALDITGDISIRIDVEPAAWGGVFQDLVAKWGLAGFRSFAFAMNPAAGQGFLRFLWTEDGTTILGESSTAGVPLDSTRLALRADLDVDNGAAGHDVEFYTAETIDGPWTQLGSTVTNAGTTSIFASSSAVALGTGSDGNQTFNDSVVFQGGRLHAAQILDAGTVVADPDFTDHEPEVRSFTDDEGLVWTLADSATLADDSIRFAGEAKSLPPRWDLSGADRWVNLTAAGISRRLQKGKKPLDSSLFRDLSERDDVVAYWPLEEPAGAGVFRSGRAGDTSTLRPTSSTEVTFANDDTSFFASAPLPTVGAAQIRGSVPGFEGADDQRMVFLVSIPADVTWGSDKVLARFFTTGSVRRWDIVKLSNDNTRLIAYDRDGTELENLLTTLPMFGAPSAISLWLQQDGADIDWQLAQFEAGSSTGLTSGTNSITGETFGRFSTVVLGTTDDMEGATFGHPFLLNDDVQSIWDVITDSMAGWSGETGLARLVRLAADEDLPPVRAIGAAADTEAMGFQRQETLMTLMREVPAADLGILTDRRDTIGLQYRTRTSLYSQDPALVLDYASGMIGEPFTPVDDDQSIANQITLTRPRGSQVTVAKTTGPLSSQDPPDGVGLYDVEQEVNVETDGRLPSQAMWRLHLGTVDEQRFPEVALNLRNERIVPLVDTILAVREGDILRIENPPIWLPAGPYDLLVEAVEERKSADTHEISFTCSPGSAWNVAAVEDDTFGKADTAGAELNTAFVAGTDTSMDVLTTLGPVWTTDAGELPFEIRTGGVVLNVTAIGAAVAGVQTFTVDQVPVNGIAKTIPAGTAVSLAHPAVIAL